MAISGTTAVVGTGNYSPDGAAFIYHKVGLVWALQSTVTDSSAIPSWGFGQPVAISSNTVVVSAFGAKTGSCTSPPCGAVDVYVKPNAGWTSTNTPTATLSDPAGKQNDYFGNSVAVSGPTILSGDYNANPPGAGPVYVFVKPNLGWISTSAPTQTLSDPAPLTNDSFGLSVAISGNTAIVGVYTASSSVGDAYVYKKGASWPAVPTPSKNPWPVPAGTGFFGIAVAISGATAYRSACRLVSEMRTFSTEHEMHCGPTTGRDLRSGLQHLRWTMRFSYLTRHPEIRLACRSVLAAAERGIGALDPPREL